MFGGGLRAPASRFVEIPRSEGDSGRPLALAGTPATAPCRRPVCTGTSANPTASPGYVCIYTYSQGNFTPAGGVVWGVGGNRWGFQVSVNATAIGEVYWFANWAYRAPTG